MKKINFKDKKTIGITILILLVLAAIIYKFHFAKNSDIEAIQEVAKEYMAQNKNYGFETKPGEIMSCISRNTFLRNDKITKIFSAQDLTDVSCKFKIENSVVSAWSVSLIKGETVYCGDSTGENTITPGITTTATVKENNFYKNKKLIYYMSFLSFYITSASTAGAGSGAGG